MQGIRPTKLEFERARRHLTQKALSETAGVSVATITAIETRDEGRRIRLTTWSRLAEALGMDLEELLDEEAAS